MPEDLPFRHSCEGPDDMPAHVKVGDLLVSVCPLSSIVMFIGTEHSQRGPSTRVFYEYSANTKLITPVLLGNIQIKLGKYKLESDMRFVKIFTRPDFGQEILQTKST